MTRLVVKVGGAVAGGTARRLLGPAAGTDEVCVVHGGGPQITAAMAEYDLPVEFVAGRRVTTPAALVLVRRALAEVNAELCATIGPPAFGLLGDEIGLVADPVLELGCVGTPRPCSPPAVTTALAAGRIPVVAPLAAGPLNVNADEAAAALAVGLDAERLLFLSDVPGLLRDGSVVPRIGADEATRMLDAGELEGGIVPKLRAAVTAARLGVTADIGETAVVA